MKVHAIGGGLRGVFGREWYRVFTVCRQWKNVNPPSKRPQYLRVTWPGVDCAKCIKARKRRERSNG